MAWGMSRSQLEQGRATHSVRQRVWLTDRQRRAIISVSTTHSKLLYYCTRMWANAQRDGRPIKYRWRPLFNAAQFGWHSILKCRAVTVPRCETRWNLQGCPKLPDRSQLLVGRSSPYCGDMWRRYCCLTSFFSDCRYMPQLRRYSPTKLCDGAQMAIFCIIFASCIFSKPRIAHFRPAF